MNIALLACSNGLGHVRRVVAISSYILKNGFKGKITAYLPKSHLDFFYSWEEALYFINHASVEIIDFNYPANPGKKAKSVFEKEWININLPDLTDYDIVWSDNITQVLADRPDAIITGSFFWHEVFEYSNNNSGLESFIYKQKKFVSEIQPIVVGNEYFSTPAVSSIKNFQPVGLYRYNISFREKKNRNILLACGLGGEEEESTRNTVRRIIEEDIKPPEYLFVEPRILPDKYPDWIIKADFSDNMFHSCLAVCIRPGMGTISDALVNRNRIFAFSNENAFEMEHNINVLEKLGVGENCSSPFDAYLKGVEFTKCKDLIDLQIMKTSHLRTDGVLATANIITGGY